MHKPIESRSNSTIGLFILQMDYWIDKPNHFSIYEFISPLETGIEKANKANMPWLEIFSYELG